MWKELKNPYFLLFNRSKIYNILVTDYIRIWEVHFSEDEFIARLKESNYFGLEIDNNELLDKGYQMLQKPDLNKNLKISIDGQILMLSMTKSFGFNLKLILYLQEGSRELFFQKVTQPAMQIIQDLRCSQQELRKMLITKDDEIEEYKSFGGKIRYTAIPAYNDEMHMKKHSVYDAYFGDTDVPASVINKIIEEPQQNIKIKEEIDKSKETEKLEPVSQKAEAPSIANMTNTAIKSEPTSQEVKPSIIANLTNTIKKESIKTESQSARKRKLNL